MSGAQPDMPEMKCSFEHLALCKILFDLCIPRPRNQPDQYRKAISQQVTDWSDWWFFFDGLCFGALIIMSIQEGLKHWKIEGLVWFVPPASWSSILNPAGVLFTSLSGTQHAQAASCGGKPTGLRDWALFFCTSAVLSCDVVIWSYFHARLWMTCHDSQSKVRKTRRCYPNPYSLKLRSINNFTVSNRVREVGKTIPRQLRLQLLGCLGLRLHWPSSWSRKEGGLQKSRHAQSTELWQSFACASQVSHISILIAFQKSD